MRERQRKRETETETETERQIDREIIQTTTKATERPFLLSR